MLALDGILVLDLTRRYPGSYSAMFLGDFGAQVIKVDPPPAINRYPGGSPQSEKYAAFFAPDRNKRNIIIDLGKKQGQQAFYRLVKKADVLIESFRPGVMKGLGADYPTLQEMNPRLIYCSLTGFGPDGPYSHLPAHDGNYCAIAGALSLIGPRDGPPSFPSNFLADMAGAGLHGVIGILIAILARGRTGRGQFVDISYVDGVLSLLSMEASRYFATGKVPHRGETVSTGGSPRVQVFQCSDGEYFTIGCAEPHFWENLCRALGREDLITSHEGDRVVADMAQIFLTRTRDEWFEFLKDKDTCVGPVFNLGETFSDPQVLHRQMVVDLEHPTLGRVKQVGIPIKLSETPGEIRSLGTPSGSDTDQILSDLGYSPDEIKGMHAEGAVE